MPSGEKPHYAGRDTAPSRHLIRWGLALWLGGVLAWADGIEFPPDDAETAIKLLEGGAAFWAGDYVQAELAFYEVLMAHPDDVSAHYYLGRICQARGLTGKAADHYEVAAGDLYPEAFFFLGLVYYREGRYDDSAARYNKYIEYYPDDAAAWFNLGVTYDAAGRDADAENAYMEVLAEDPRSVASLHNLAVLYHRRSDYRRAIFFWNRLLEVAPDDADAYFGLGQAHYYSGDYLEAASAFNEGAQLAPFESKFFFYAARVYFEMNKYDLAVGFYKRAYELGYDEGDVAQGMGLAYEGWGRYGEAAPLLKKATELKGDEAGPAYAALGRIEREMGRPGLALANFYEAAARLADAGDVYNQIGELYLEADLASWAAEAFGLAVEAEPDNLNFNYNLAVARELSDPSRAPEQWRRYLALAEGVPGEKRRAAEAAERLERLLGDKAEGVRP